MEGRYFTSMSLLISEWQLRRLQTMGDQPLPQGSKSIRLPPKALHCPF